MTIIRIMKYPLLLFLLVFLMCPCGLLAEDAASVDAAETEELVTFDFKDAKLSDVLRSMAYSYNLNLVAPKDIKGNVSLPLTDVTIYEALDVILSTNGYTYTKKGNIIYITPGPGLAGVGSRTENLSLKYLNAYEASQLLEDAISSEGSIRVNEANNSLVVTDYPAYIDNLRGILSEIDTAPIQVLIESRLIDITESALSNFGLSWTVNSRFFSLGGSQSMAGPSSSLPGAQLSLSSIAGSGVTANATIDALLRNNKAHLLASPSILTLSGKEARIIIGERYPYTEKTQTTTGTTETTKFVDIGTTLRVTPWVSPEGPITMYVHPEVSSLTAELDAGPRIATREADATIIVEDGETIVIGGLIKKQDDAVKGKVPLLGHIPILGLLFRQGSSDVTTTELVVFITPHIIRSRDEIEDWENVAEKEFVVSIEETSQQVLVNALWEEAENLKKGKGVISRNKNKSDRMILALERYKRIASIYPNNPQSDEALFRGAKIAYKYLDDLETSQAMLARLVVEYQDSPLVKKAEKLLRKMDKKILTKSRRGK